VTLPATRTATRHPDGPGSREVSGRRAAIVARVADDADEQLTGPVLVVGAGLLGTSVGLALRRAGLEVLLTDVVEHNVTIAAGVGAGRPLAHDDTPRLVVVAVPPDHLGPEIIRALQAFPSAVVTDVGSVKGAPLAEVRAKVTDAELGRYTGGHPMAGSERSGPFAASASLFDGRPWAMVPHECAAEPSVSQVRALVRACGATPVALTPDEHDAAVARTSHVPHLIAALVAGRLVDAPAAQLALSGQGLRDVTRIAGGDPRLWRQIVSANAAAIVELLAEVRADLDRLTESVRAERADEVTRLLDRGVAGTAPNPGKHGGPPRADALVYVAVPDHPGELARLLGDAGTIGVNVEDLRIDHDPARPVGLVELTVAEDRADYLVDALEERGWTAHR
jgi:prephenate dehydrogenase